MQKKRHKLGCKKEANLDAKRNVNMGAIVDTKLDEKLDASEVDVKVDAKWDAKNIKNI